MAIKSEQLEAVDLDLAYGRMAAAARGMIRGVKVVIYGSVLLWNGINESGILQPGETYREAFPRILIEQAAYVHPLAADHPDATVVWAGDFNQALAPPHHSGGSAHRHVLQDTLDHLKLVAWNGREPAAIEGLRTIDLICGSAHCQVKSIGLISATVAGRSLSDHIEYEVEL